MKTVPMLAIAAAFALPLPALAQTGGAMKATAPGMAAAANKVKVTATITAIDKATRSITLKGPKGNEHTLVAGPEVKKFDMLKVGDQVNVEYIEALTLELKKDGKAVVARTEEAVGAKSKPDEKPAAGVARAVKAVGNVTAVDAATMTVTVKGPQRTVELKLRDPEQFKLVKVGDQIEANYIEALAVSVEPAAAPAKK